MIFTGHSIEFLIIGGGPAGSAAACALAEHGRNVLIVEKGECGSPRIGETLPSLANPILARLGLNMQLLHRDHLRCPGVVSIWGSSEPFLNDFISDPDGDGLHLDRRKFDAMLLSRAESNGATILKGAEVQSCRHDQSNWDVTIKMGEKRVRLSASMVIDAAGRKAWPGRPTQRLSFDRQVAMVRTFAVEAGSPTKGEHRIWIESAAGGWWFSTSVADDRCVAAYFTDSDLLNASPRHRENRWSELLDQSPTMRHRLRCLKPLDAPRIVPASSSISSAIALPQYLAIGDAASTIDPLSSHGIFYALSSGLSAADALLEQEPQAAIANYVKGIATRLRADLRTRYRFCQLERRWSDAPFWLRRTVFNGP